MRARRRPSSDVLLPLLGRLDGARIPGGCDHCNAFQTVAPASAGVWVITVHHDDWCPWYVAHSEGNARGETRPA